MDEETRSGTAGNGSGPGQRRNPVMVLVLMLVTLGIYGLYWHWSVMKEIDRFDPYRKSPFDIAKWAIPAVLIGFVGYFASFATTFAGAAAGSEAGLGAGMIFLMVSGLLVFVAGIAMLVAQWRLWKGVETHERSIGEPNPLSPGLMLALILIPFVNMVGAFYVPYRTQQGLNRVWDAADDGYEAKPPRRAGGVEQGAGEPQAGGTGSPPPRE